MIHQPHDDGIGQTSWSKYPEAGTLWAPDLPCIIERCDLEASAKSCNRVTVLRCDVHDLLFPNGAKRGRGIEFAMEFFGPAGCVEKLTAHPPVDNFAGFRAGVPHGMYQNEVARDSDNFYTVTPRRIDRHFLSLQEKESGKKLLIVEELEHLVIRERL